ncbi:hypothetical protein JNUCC0626_26930 [Lentzea sp. JNUCC 0626]|uniref:hypothetical protein n=1 Tax=Lentzea sp. JNUCC 0626 TaxID=3367513 RepID=UPI003749A1DE
MRATLLGVLLALGSVVVAAGPANAAGPCSVSNTRTTPGGHMVKLHCSSPTAFIDGFGTTVGDANREGLLLRQFQNNGGPLCSGFLSSPVTGGYEFKLTCTSPTSFADAYGTTLTDAAREARLLKEIAPDRHCSHDFISTVSGGYKVKASCTKPTIFFEGVGATVTQAAENARLASGI